MRRQPIPSHGRLWHTLLAVLVLGGLGIWHGGHCLDASVRPAATTAADPATTAAAPAPAALAAVATTGHPTSHAHTGLEIRHTAADCHVATSTEPATTTSITSVTPPAAHTSTVVAAAARPPMPRLLTASSLTQIGVSRT